MARGYYGDPFHEPQKRTYRPCEECGEQTWSPQGICSRCSGKSAINSRYAMSGRGDFMDHYRKKAIKAAKMLRKTNLTYQAIADMLEVDRQFVGKVFAGTTYAEYTGWPIERPFSADGVRFSAMLDNQRAYADVVPHIADLLRETDLSFVDIGNRVGVSDTFVRSICIGKAYQTISGGPIERPYQRDGSARPPGSSHIPRETVEYIVELLETTLATYEEIGEAASVTAVTVGRICRGQRHTDITGGPVARPGKGWGIR